MTTTALSSFASSYAVGLRHVHFNLRSSTPTTGALSDGWGEWYVFIGGSEVPARRAIGTLDYGGEFPDGAIVRARYVDRTGDAGAWVDYTVAVTGTYAATLYVSAAGNNANAGTEASPIATVEEAMSRMNSTLTAGQVGAVYYRRGDTFTPGGTVTLTGTDAKLVRSLAYGTGARPILRWTNTSGLAFTDATSLHVEGLELDGQQVAPDEAVAIGCNRASPTAPVNLMVRDCVFRNWKSCIVFTGDNGEDGANWTDGRGDFVCVTDSEFYNSGSLHFFASWSARYMVWRDCYLGDTNGESGPNIWRVRRPRDSFFHRVTWEPQNNGSLRWEVGPSLASTDKMERVSMLGCKLIAPENPSQHFFNKFGFGRTAPDGAGEGYLEDVRLVGCVASRAEFMFQGCSLTRVQLWGCEARGGGYRLWPANATTAGTIYSVEFRDCAHVDDEDGNQTFWFQDSPSLYQAGSITITGCVRWVRSGVSNRFLIVSAAMTVAETVAKLAACDGNRVGLQSSTTFEWIGGTDASRDLAWWQANTVYDDNSSVTSSVGTANFTNVGTTLALVDLRRTASASFVNDTGFVRLGFDVDGLARSPTTPDAGPFEFGASPVAGPPAPVTTFGVATLDLQAFGSGAEEAAPAAPGPGVQISNTGTATFIGWLPINTDLPLSATGGQITVADSLGGTQTVHVVRGDVTSIDTRRAHLLITIPAGSTIQIPSLIPTTTNPVPSTTIDPDFFSGKPTLGGVEMDLHSQATEGASQVYEYRLRSGVWMVYLWATWFPGEPWARCEVAILHSNPTTAALSATWPGWKLSWGDGVFQVLGQLTAGDLTTAGRVFGDGQMQIVPAVSVWSNRFRDASDETSANALLGWGINAHGIQRLLHDGNPSQTPQSTTWGAAALGGAIERLHNSAVSPYNILPDSGPTGSQSDQFFVREEPLFDVSATLPAYLEACRWGMKPCHFVEVNGNRLDLAARPRFRCYDGRPHQPTTQDEPGQPGSGMLGKPGPLNPPEHAPVTGEPTAGWNGPGWEHWLINGLVAAARYTGSRALQWDLTLHANLYLASRFPDSSFGLSNAALFSTRGLLYEAANCVHWYRELADRTLASDIRTRFQLRADSTFSPWIYPTHTEGYPASYWQVYDESTTASVPFIPAYIPWQQGPCAYFLDLAVRVLGGLSSLSAGIAAGAAQVLSDTWNLEGSRWVEYERQELPPPWGLGREGRSGDFVVAWLPPVVAYTLRYDSGNAKALQLWQQFLGDTASGLRSWLPPLYLAPSGGGGPSPIPFEEPFVQANGSGLLGLLGSGSGTTAPGTSDADGSALLGLLLSGSASSAASTNAFGNGVLGFLLAGEATAPVSGFGGLQIEFLGFGLGTRFDPNGPGVPPTGGGGAQECPSLWEATKASYDEDGLIALTNVRNRAAVTINDVAGEDAAAGVIALWPVYAQEPFDNCNPTHIEVGKRAVIAMLWARGGTATTIAQVNWDEVFSPDGMISKVRRTGARGRMAPRSNSDVRAARPTEAYRGWADADALPPGVMPSRWRADQ